MVGGKLFCVLSMLGLAAAATKFDINKFNSTSLHKPYITSKSQSAQAFFDRDFCRDWADLDAFPHPDSCEQYLICWLGELWEQSCEVGQLFDPWLGWCDDAANVVCLDEQYPEYPGDDWCPPPSSTEIRFLPSLYCDEYYVCVGGEPILLTCRDGQHWNAEKEYCDDPGSAGCDPDADATHEELPNCPPGFVGQYPHPHNCNWFIHCNNGNRVIQQCQHLFHFDIDEERCLFQSIARCIKHENNGHGRRHFKAVTNV